MKTTHLIASALLGLSTTAVVSAAAFPDTPAPDRVSVYYFGNSLTGSTNPELHTALGKSAGKEWVWELMAVAGGQLWQYRDQFELDAKLGGVGEFTIDPEIAKKAPYAAQKFLNGQWDAVVLQPFATRLKIIAREMWGKKYETDRDFGDLAAATYLIELALKKNPACRIYIYQDWPGLSLAGGEFGRAADGVGKTGKELAAAHMLPVARSFDFPREWLRATDQNADNWLSGAQSRSYDTLLFGELIKAFPKLWEEGRLRMIPVGDIYYALDRKMRAGKVPGVLNIGEFYTDTLHHRAGMPAYTCSAAFFTLLFGTKPHGLDFALYNNLDAYGRDHGKGKDEHNDAGTVLEITPERAAAINDTVWEVVNAHPFTRFAPAGSAEALAKYEQAIPAPEAVRVLEYGYAPAWSAMPFWQGALDATAGKATAWSPVLQREAWIQNGGCEWVANVFRQKVHPYNFPGYGTEMEERYYAEPLRHRALCLQPSSASEKEVDAFVFLAKYFMERRENGFPMAFFPWPAIPEAAALKTELKLEKWQVIPEEKMGPIRKGFDYAAAWGTAGESSATAAGSAAFAEKLKAADLAVAAKFRAIPAGALLAALDAKLKAGALPGTGGVGEFYKDDVTLRTGLPRYAVAALRFATVHRAHPKDLDAAFFDQPKTYPPDGMDPERKRGRGKADVVVRDDDYDNGPHFPVTKQGKRLVDDTIWELVGTARQ